MVPTAYRVLLGLGSTAVLPCSSAPTSTLCTYPTLPHVLMIESFLYSRPSAEAQNVAKTSHSGNGVTVPSPPAFYSSTVCNTLPCFKPEGVPHTRKPAATYMRTLVSRLGHRGFMHNCPYPYPPSKLGTVPSDCPFSGHVASYSETSVYISPLSLVDPTWS